MRQTKLILVEGIPGSGKSTMGQYLESHIAAAGVPVTWWYEEQKGHPLYIFDDEASLRDVVADLRAGRFGKLVDAALIKWGRFAEETARGDAVVILDSCLFGYLTWSLFPQEAPVDLIARYVLDVGRIIRDTMPCLICLYQEDVARTLTRLCETRGRSWTDAFVKSAEQAPYHKRRNLRGFAGLVAYWTDYQAFTKRCFETVGGAKLQIDGSAGDWSHYQEQIRQLIELPSGPTNQPTEDDIRPFVGTYRPNAEDSSWPSVQVNLENGELFASGLPGMWPRNRLIPAANLTFRVASFPCDVHFVANESGVIQELHVRGRDLLSGQLNQVFVRTDNAVK
jgi:thymidylate kinase